MVGKKVELEVVACGAGGGLKRALANDYSHFRQHESGGGIYNFIKFKKKKRSHENVIAILWEKMSFRTHRK